MPSRSTRHISGGLGSRESAIAPKSASKRRRWRRSPMASGHSRRRPMSSRRSTGRRPIWERRQTRSRIFSCMFPPARISPASRKQLLANSLESRGSDTGRVSQPQPCVLAVRHGCRGRSVRGRVARRHRRHGHRRPNALFQHQGSSERIRDAARHRIVEPVHSQSHHLAGAAQRRHRLFSGCWHRPGHRQVDRRNGAADRHDAGTDVWVCSCSRSSCASHRPLPPSCR